MPWSYVGVSSVASANGGDITLTEPSGVAEGDLLVAIISYRSNAAFTSPGSPWVLVEEQNTGNTTANNNTGSIGSGVMFYCKRGSSAPGLTFTRTSGDIALGRILAYRGQDPTAPLVVSTSTTLAAGATAVSVTGLTTQNPRDLIVFGLCNARNASVSAFRATDPGTSSGTASNETVDPTENDWHERCDSATTTGADCGLAVADALRATAGATGNLLCTASSSGRHVVVAAAFAEDTTAYTSLETTEPPDVAAFDGYPVPFAALDTTEAPDTAAATVIFPGPAFNGEAYEGTAFDATSAGYTATLAATEASDTAAVAIAAAHTAALAATEAPDTAALAISAAHTASLAATEASDTAAVAIAAAHTAALAATEASDTAALAISAAHTASLAATEVPDTAAFAVTVRDTATLAATEAPDTAAVAISAAHTATLDATEAPDTAQFTTSDDKVASLAATEAPDTAAVAISAAHTAALAATEASDTAALEGYPVPFASLAATEAPDTAAVAISAAHAAALSATEASDTAALAISAAHTAALAATEAPDTAAVAISARHTAALAATEAPDVASITTGERVILDATEAPDTAAVDLTAAHTAALAATEPPDVAAADVLVTYILQSDGGTITLAGNAVDLLRFFAFDAEGGDYQVTGEPTFSSLSRVFAVGAGQYTYDGFAAGFLRSSFYGDSEIAYVYAEANTIVIGSRNLLDEGISVPAEAQAIAVGYEERTITVSTEAVIEELAEYREVTVQSRKRAV